MIRESNNKTGKMERMEEMEEIEKADDPEIKWQCVKSL
jgi:hypothetical protein